MTDHRTLKQLLRSYAFTARTVEHTCSKTKCAVPVLPKKKKRLCDRRKNTELKTSTSRLIGQEEFYQPIAKAGLPTPFFLPFVYPANYTNAETPSLEQQRAIVRGFGTAMAGLWYWGCAPLADAVVNSSRATVQACREAQLYVATPVSGASVHPLHPPTPQPGNASCHSS